MDHRFPDHAFKPRFASYKFQAQALTPSIEESFDSNRRPVKLFISWLRHYLLAFFFCAVP